MEGPLIQDISRFIRRHRLLNKKDSLLLAVSGGSDSTALLLLFHEHLRRLFGLKLAVAHFNHRLRKKASDRDEAFVRRLCRRLDVPFFSGKLRVRKKRGLSPEEHLREARYDFLFKTAEKQGFSRIATAHHLDDQAETVLMRLLSGSGPLGLRGIRVKRGKLIRPLLSCTKDDLLAYLKERKQAFRTDRTNADTAYFRNRVRLKLIPFLKKEFGPHVVRTLSRVADKMRSEHSFRNDAPPGRRHDPATVTEKNRDAPAGRRCGKRPRLMISIRPNRPGIVFPRADENRAFFDAEKTLTPMPPLPITGEGVRDAGLVLRHRKDGDRFFPLGAPGEKKLKAFLIDQKIPRRERDRLLLLEADGRIAWVAGVRIAEPFKVTPASRKILEVKIAE